MTAIKLKLVAKKLEHRESAYTPVEIAGEMYDGEELHNRVNSGELGLDDLHRKELLAMAWFLGVKEDDTRGKPVRMLRELLNSLINSETEPEASTPEPAPAPKKLGAKPAEHKPVAKLGPAKLTQTLGTIKIKRP
jgi:hypothetical protein